MARDGIIRNFVFGVEDSLVSTVGFISGIATAGMDRSTLLLTGVVLIVVEASSMAMGSFVSDESVREYHTRTNVRARPSIIGGGVMFLSYFGAGLIVLAPYFSFPPTIAVGWSIAVSLATLFLLGVISARASGLPILARCFRMMMSGGIAIAIGALVARIAGAHILP